MPSLHMGGLMAVAATEPAVTGSRAMVDVKDYKIDVRPDLGKLSVEEGRAWRPGDAAHQDAVAMRSSAARTFFAWLFQLLASCAWVASVIVYGSYESGDILQLAAALCWTLSNVVSAPEVSSAVVPLLRRGERQPAEEKGDKA